MWSTLITKRPVIHPMAQYGALLLLALVCGADAQGSYYQPLRLYQPNVPYLHPALYRQHQQLQHEQISLPRRSPPNECSAHPGSTCMFVLLCLMGGGTAAAPCSSGVLSTCCVPSNAQAPPVTLPTPPRWPQTPSNTRETKREDAATVTATTTEVASTTVRPPRTNYTQCGISNMKPQSRIIGGSDASYGEFPWQAHIKLNKQQCGGVLLNNYYVLTAAHCIYQVNVKDITVQLGVHDIQDASRHEHKPQTFRVTEKKLHPMFQYRAAHPDRYDVALLRLSRAARYRDSVRPVCLPRHGWDLKGKKAVITGWGKTDPGMGNRFGTRLLQKVEVPIMSNEQCEVWHGEKGIDISVSEEMLCAGYEEGQKDACVGDSGGPLMVLVHGRWVVVGLVSAGFGCAQNKQPGIYHRVPHTVDWLRESISS
ncbi:hypothetical protein JTE90_018429 [Oedothorax gibbosus]|uniref:Peptidase S1 domain-containing protein n=1 Tax=Oedothorax gibbosus TaxID=931172 RepID=A0AAV6UXB8_9ARAC|nr:hypothetical protein JTE90_018429 [Oedothorax gibbosus]